MSDVLAPHPGSAADDVDNVRLTLTSDGNVALYLLQDNEDTGCDIIGLTRHQAACLRDRLVALFPADARAA